MALKQTNIPCAYSAEAIEVLEGLEPVRRRPGMYIGDVHDGTGLLQMVWEVVGNVLDQHLARRATQARIDVSEDGWVTVEDDGPGLPVEPIARNGRRAIEVIFTEFRRSLSWDDHLPHIHIGNGLNGIGLAPVCALSSRLEVETRRDGKLWRASFERGHVTTPLAIHGAASKTGTRIRFRPDAAIFGPSLVDAAAVESRLRELAWLYPLLTLEWRGERLPGRGGPAEWLKAMTGGAIDTAASFTATRVIDDGYVDLAIGWQLESTSMVRAFVNGTDAKWGTHVGGLWEGLVAVAREYGCDAADGVIRELLAPGLVGVLHVGLISPKFASPDRSQLSSPLAGTAVRRAITEGLPLALRRKKALAAAFRSRLLLSEDSASRTR